MADGGATAGTQQETVVTNDNNAGKETVVTNKNDTGVGGGSNDTKNSSKDTTVPPDTSQSKDNPDQTQTQTKEGQTTDPDKPDSTTADSTKEKSSERVVPKPDEYKIPEGLPKELGQFAHENEYTQEQLDAAVKMFDSYSQAMKTSQQIALRQLGEAHIKNWGDEANFKLTLAKRALKQNDPNGALAKALNESGYGNHPAVLDFLANLGEQMREGGFLKSAVNRPPGKKSLAQAMFPDHPSKEL